MKTFYTHDQIRERLPYLVPGIEESSHRHFHFQPARPANLLVTVDRETREVNVSAGTIGPLTWDPYTIAIHCGKGSLDSMHNIQQVGSECVIGLPGTDIVHETWITALCVPRGINEARLARLTLYPSRMVEPPSVAECPVNYECVIEYFREQHSHWIAFLRVVGASVDEALFHTRQEEAMRQFPTWEVDDITNEWGGDVERLGVLGELLLGPPARAPRGWGSAFGDWLGDLQASGELGAEEYETAQSWLIEWARVSPMTDSEWDADADSQSAPAESQEVSRLRERLKRLCELVAWDEFDELHRLLTAR